MELSHFSLFLWSLVLFRFPSNYISNTVIQYIVWEQTVEYQYFLSIGWIWEIVIFYRKPPRYFPISFPIFIWLVSVFSSVILRIIRFSSSNCMFVNNRDPAQAAVSTLFCLIPTRHLDRIFLLSSYDSWSSCVTICGPFSSGWSQFSLFCDPWDS